MKKNILIFTLITLIFSACNQLEMNETFKLASNPADKFHVSLVSIKKFISITTHNDSIVILDKIDPVIYNGDTLLYIVNYKENKGWSIISGDKRTPAILASDETGSFDINKANQSVLIWLDETANRIYNLKKSGIADTTKTDYILWNNIEILTNEKPQKMVAPIAEQGYWELVSIYSQTLPSIQKGPFIQTKWGQGDDIRLWNTCVPYNKEYTKRCLVGCSAVATGQMLYYLHNQIGVPSATYEQGSCSGYSENGGILGGIFDTYNYAFSFSNYNTTVWNKMAINWWDPGINYSAVYLGYVAKSINTRFGVDGSGAYSSDFINFIRNNGINCSNEVNYDYPTVLASLNNNMPVLTTARTLSGYTWVLFVRFNNYAGHAFIIDGYVTQRTQYTYYYQWVATTGGGIQPAMLVKQKTPSIINQSKTEVSVSTNTLLTMNWGWDGSYDSGLYSLNSDWLAGGNDQVNYNFVYQRKMITGFSK